MNQDSLLTHVRNPYKQTELKNLNLLLRRYAEKVSYESFIRKLVGNGLYGGGKIPNVMKQYQNFNSYLGLAFAKNFSKRINEFEGKKVYCFDLKDLEKHIQ